MTRTFIISDADRTDSEPKLSTDTTAATDVTNRIVSVSKGKNPLPFFPSDSALISVADSVVSSQCCVLPQTMITPTHPNWTHRSQTQTDRTKFGRRFGRFGSVWFCSTKFKAHDSVRILFNLVDLVESLRGCTCERAPACACARARPHPAVPPSSKNRPNRPNRPKGRSRLLVFIWSTSTKRYQIATKSLPTAAVGLVGGRSQ